MPPPQDAGSVALRPPSYAVVEIRISLIEAHVDPEVV
jgi:hypothetical protein